MVLILLIILLVIVALLIVWWVRLYNELNTSRNQISNAESSLDALIIKRHDLIPNLITVIKQNTRYEKEVLEQITRLRSGDSPKQEYVKDSELSSAVKNLMVQIENYPVLKANEQFGRLSVTWNEVEEQISAGRRYISASITWYNDAVKTFPSNVVARFSGFQPYAWERATAEQQQEIHAENLF
jgi:LemA protein